MANCALGAAVILSRVRPPKPRGFKLRLPRRRWLLIDFLLGLQIGATISVFSATPLGLLAGIGCGLTLTVATVIVESLGLERILNIERMVDPIGAYRLDRTAAFMAWIAVGGFGSIAGSIIYGLTAKDTSGFWSSVAITESIALVALLLATAWGQFVVARSWLSARNTMPIRLLQFLNDANEKGILRRQGAFWEFRHVTLQRYLAELP
jgi:hypothetical protein